MTKNMFLVFLFLLVSPLLASEKKCKKLIITANKTDMKAEVVKYEKQGWEKKGRVIFRDYSFQQWMANKKCFKNTKISNQ